VRKIELSNNRLIAANYMYEISRNLPPREDVGTHSRAEQMKRAERFL
jgi:hypothetical protein